MRRKVFVYNRDNPDETAAVDRKVDILIDEMKTAKKAGKTIDKDDGREGRSPRRGDASGDSEDTDDRRRANERKLEAEAKLKRTDSPGMDLSVFQPRGKRKCVLESEGKRAAKKPGWWSDDDDGDDDDEVVADDRVTTMDRAGKEDRLGLKQSDKKLKRPSVSSDRHQKDSKNSESLESYPRTLPLQKASTSKSYVFSTAMANRAGHFVQKGDFSSITAYHRAQFWETPYLNPELHCRPFIPVLEDQRLKEQRALPSVNGIRASERSISIGDQVIRDGSSSAYASEQLSEKLGCQEPVLSQTDHRELSMDEAERHRVIQAAKQMSRLVGSTSPSSMFGRDLASNCARDSSFASFRSKILADSSPAKLERESATGTESEASPQTVPKGSECLDTEARLGDGKSELERRQQGYGFVRGGRVSPPCSDRDNSEDKRGAAPFPVSRNERKKELSSPPQLVPTFKSNVVPRSYPADVTNVKSQSSYSADVQREEHVQTFRRSPDGAIAPAGRYLASDVSPPEENTSRPSVLNMSAPVIKSGDVRSSIDIAEKALKEMRANSYSHHGAESFLRPNGHHPVLPLPHSPHLSGYSPHMPNTVMSSRASPTSSAQSMQSSRPSYMSPPPSVMKAIEEDVRASAMQRYSLTAVSDFPVGSGLSSHRGSAPEVDRRGEHVHGGHRTTSVDRSISPRKALVSSQRPSSLPMHAFFAREHPKPLVKSFSVERLTGGDERKNHIPPTDSSLSERLTPDRAVHERSRLMDPARVPNGLRLPNGLSKQPPEDWSPVRHHFSHVQDRPLHDPKLLFDVLHGREVRDSVNHHHTVAQSDSRSPVPMIPPYLQRPVPNGNARETFPPSPTQLHQFYHHMHHLGVNPFANAASGFPSR